MVQSQAAIVSLVITLTLIAIQMTAASYSTRVVDVMKKNPDMWFLFVIYIESMVMGFITLVMVDNPNRSLVSSILILDIYTFLTLFLYMLNTINLLRPDVIVKMLVDDINTENILQTEWNNDIMQPVFDVVQASINRFDVTTTRTGLIQLTMRVEELYLKFNSDERDQIVDHLFKHFERSSLIAIGNKDEGTLGEIILVLEKFGQGIWMDEENRDGRHRLIQVLKFIENNADTNGLTDLANEAKNVRLYFDKSSN